MSFYQHWSEIIIDVEVVFGRTFKIYEDTKDLVDEVLEQNSEFFETKTSRGKKYPDTLLCFILFIIIV